MSTTASCPPKRPKTGFFRFMDEFRPKFKSANSDASIGDIGRAGGAAWKALDDASKSKFNEQATSATVEYKAALAAFMAANPGWTAPKKVRKAGGKAGKAAAAKERKRED